MCVPPSCSTFRREHRLGGATEEGEGSEESADKDLGEDEPILVRFAGAHKHLQQQNNIHSTHCAR
ncbi:hypothetical protein DUNSADRAFT_16464 [Dunaliella salina]|uniref:Encoded protein n=1 Tax=Dunaliella salina TaxID=3046 RepID=A0ABQ7H0Z2_DUNSA|nr:hypothetical protein DUNSADRAFT_16464 [Dunaliella salina]|eukprot:KAF5840523.1 hypothetical protein DUNSADRAFT_16464 [Dunaliella salina]